GLFSPEIILVLDGQVEVMVNVGISLIMENLSNPLISFLVSSILMVFVGEIIPQAICYRHGLAIGAALWWLIFFFMVILSPIVFPLGFLLDKILGEEVGNTYSRKQLKKLIEIHTKENIMGKYGEDGINKTDFIFLKDAFEFSNKNAQQVMTKMEDVFLLDTTDILDYELIERVVMRGHSRIPVCEPLAPDYAKYNTNNILGYIESQDLLLLYNQEHEGNVDSEIFQSELDNAQFSSFDPQTPFSPINIQSKLTIGSIFNQFGHEKVQILNDTILPQVLKQLKKAKSQMAIVYAQDNSNEEQDPISFNEGIITREDIAKVFIGDEDEEKEEDDDDDFELINENEFSDEVNIQSQTSYDQMNLNRKAENVTNDSKHVFESNQEIHSNKEIEMETNSTKQQMMSIAGICGWTFAHMAQLVRISTVFIVPAYDKEGSEQTNVNKNLGLRIKQFDQVPLRSQICQQGLFSPEIILVLDGQVEVCISNRKIMIQVK
ncbi:MAG: metal transporter CNNM, partial [Streblomastix strix]